MENIIQHIILDVSTNKHVIVKVNQYDIKIRDIYAKIVDNGRPYIIESTIIPRIKCKKSDGTIIVNDCFLLDNGDIHIKVTDQMTACAGIHECKLLLLDSLNEQALHTMKFYINVDEDVFSDDEITSSNEYVALENALLKVDNFNNHINNKNIHITSEEQIKLSNIEENAEVNKIDAIKVNNETLGITNKEINISIPTKVSDLLNDEIATNSATGSPIYIENSADGSLISFKAYGRSEQVIYTGKNLLQHAINTQTIEGIAFIVNDDGSITVNGTNSTESSVYVQTFITLPAGEYILSGSPNNGGSSKYSLLVIDVNNSMTLGSDYGEGVTFILIEETCIDIRCRIASGYTATNLVFYPMIRLKTITDDTYEPYVGGIISPNPNYPQEIRSIASEGVLEIKSCGKNLIPYPYCELSKTINGITFTVNNDGSVNIKGTSTSNAWLYLWSSYFSKPIFLAKGKYKVNGGKANTCVIRVSSTISDNSVCNCWKNETEFTLEENKDDINVQIGVLSGTTIDETIYPMIYRADVVDTTYEPYKENIMSMPLDEPLRSIGNIKDELEWQDGMYGILRRIGTITLDGSSDEGWTTCTNYNGDFACYYYTEVGTNAKKGYKTSLCSHFTNENMVWNKGTIGAYSDSPSSASKYFISNLSEEEWLIWLSENPITVEYILAEEIFEPFTDQTPFYNIITYFPITNIFSTNNAEMDIIYFTNSIDGQNLATNHRKITNNYTVTDHTHNLATTNSNGFMSSSDKKIINGLGSASTRDVDIIPTSGSTNLITSGVVYNIQSTVLELKESLSKSGTGYNFIINGNNIELVLNGLNVTSSSSSGYYVTLVGGFSNFLPAYTPSKNHFGFLVSNDIYYPALITIATIDSDTIRISALAFVDGTPSSMAGSLYCHISYTK